MKRSNTLIDYSDSEEEYPERSFRRRQIHTVPNEFQNNSRQVNSNNSNVAQDGPNASDPIPDIRDCPFCNEIFPNSFRDHCQTHHPIFYTNYTNMVQNGPSQPRNCQLCGDTVPHHLFQDHYQTYHPMFYNMMYCPATFNVPLPTFTIPSWTKTLSSLHPCLWIRESLTNILDSVSKHWTLIPQLMLGRPNS